MWVGWGGQVVSRAFSVPLEVPYCIITEFKHHIKIKLANMLMEELAKLILILCPWALPGPQNGYVMEEINPFWDIRNSRNTNKRGL